MAADPTRRFSDRADDYARYRPTYPPTVAEVLRHECGLERRHLIADVGAGTGLLSAMLLEAGQRVVAVEPNEAMRAAADASLGANPLYSSLAGRSEATGLPDGSVDLITVAQAIHWFEPQATAAEFRRILRPDGWLAVIRNQRRTDDPFGHDMAALMAACPDPQPGPRWNLDDGLMQQYYGPAGPALHLCDNHQVLDFDGLVGLWMSRSRVPKEGQPGHDELIADLRRLFDQYQTGGTVRVNYHTEVRVGRLAG